SPNSCQSHPQGELVSARTGHVRESAGRLGSRVSMEQPVYVGIDVSKATLDVAIGPTAKRWQVANDESGIQPLVYQLNQVHSERIVLEATGGYELPALAALGCTQLPVVAINPRQAREFA